MNVHILHFKGVDNSSLFTHMQTNIHIRKVKSVFPCLPFADFLTTTLNVALAS